MVWDLLCPRARGHWSHSRCRSLSPSLSVVWGSPHTQSLRSGFRCGSWPGPGCVGSGPVRVGCLSPPLLCPGDVPQTSGSLSRCGRSSCRGTPLLGLRCRCRSPCSHALARRTRLRAHAHRALWQDRRVGPTSQRSAPCPSWEAPRTGLPLWGLVQRGALCLCFWVSGLRLLLVQVHSGTQRPRTELRPLCLC